jgi:histidyl-tRNA synthetase
LPEDYQSIPSVKNLTDVLARMKAFGVSNIEFDITLMRGFDYYTDIVFEVFDNDPENNRSMFGGGRYDGLVAQFGVDAVPTVGFGMGDVTFMDFLDSHKLLPNLKKKTEVVLIIREPELIDRAQSVARELREMGANVAVDYTERKIDKQFKSALKTGIRHAIFVGHEELETEQYILKDLKTNKEEKHSLQRIVSMVRDSRKK